MRLPWYRIPILMVAMSVATTIAVIYFASLAYGPGPTALTCLALAVISPVFATLFYFGRKLGMNTLFR